MRTSLIAIAALVGGFAAGAANAQFFIPPSAAVAGSVSVAGSSSGAGSHGNGASNSTSGAGNASYGTAQVSSGPDNFYGNPGAVHNNVLTSSGTNGGTYSTGNSLGSAGAHGHGSQGGAGVGLGWSYTPFSFGPPNNEP
jgi:hypothetical protein